jgi:ubiquinone/menaquinone biosynthesis C-methylase UbiE
MFSKEQLSCFCDPHSHALLKLISENDSDGKAFYFLVDSENKVKYPIVDGIINVLDQNEVVGRNKRYQGLYDDFAPFYSFVQKLIGWYFKLFRKTRENPVIESLANLGIKPGNKVLEVSVGTGDNIADLPIKNIQFYGLDISLGMLKNCWKRYKKSDLVPVLVHGMAEALPFQDETFDVVIHVGGINFFNDKAKAIQEMIRVAKPGARFIISDETEKVAKACENRILARRFFKNRDEEIVPPIDMIPKNMQDVDLQLREDGSLYFITFKKP